MSIKLVTPVQGTLTDAFGWRAAIPGVVDAQLHTGQDWAAPKGTPIYAMHAGRVNRVWWDTMLSGAPAGGNMLQIGAAQCSSRYAHLDSYAVTLGQHVNAGDLIGHVGSTGAATGDHLHGELLIGGMFVDPMPYIKAALPALARTPTAPARRRKKGPKMLFLWCAEKKRYYTVTPGVKGSFWSFETASDNASRMANQLGNAMHVSAGTYETHEKKWG